MRRSHTTQAHLVASYYWITSPTGEWLFTHAQSSLTGCHVTARPRDRSSRYSKWTDTCRTDLVHKMSVLFFPPHLQPHSCIQWSITRSTDINSLLFLYPHIGISALSFIHGCLQRSNILCVCLCLPLFLSLFVCLSSKFGTEKVRLGPRSFYSILTLLTWRI